MMTLKRKRILIAFIVLISCVVIAGTVYLCLFFFTPPPKYDFDLSREEVESYLPKYRLLEDDPLLFDSAQFHVRCEEGCTKAKLNKSKFTSLTASYNKDKNFVFTVYYDRIMYLRPDDEQFSSVTQEIYAENGFTVTTQILQYVNQKSFVCFFETADSISVAVEILSDDPSSVKEKAKSIVSKLTKLYAS